MELVLLFGDLILPAYHVPGFKTHQYQPKTKLKDGLNVVMKDGLAGSHDVAIKL
jgi:hypothetical protein